MEKCINYYILIALSMYLSEVPTISVNVFIFLRQRVLLDELSALYLNYDIGLAKNTIRKISAVNTKSDA